jgi:hypothetical protein
MEIVAAELWEYDQKINVKTWEFIILPVYILLISIISFFYQNYKLNKFDYYKYFTLGLVARISGGLFFVFIYLYYYGGGDTTSYFESSKAMANLFYKNPIDYFTVLFSPPSDETRSLFTIKTGYPWAYLFYDSHTFMVVKITSVFTIITFKSYLLTTALIASITYYAVWKVFVLFVTYFPSLQRQMAFSILFFPSTLFWGAGVSKDTYTYFGVLLMFYSIYILFINKRYSNNKHFKWVPVLIGFFLIINIKPYIMLVFLPCAFMWIFYDKYKSIKVNILKYLVAPLGLVLVVFLSYFILNSMGDKMSKFSVDKALETAAITNYDLKQDYYGGSAFNIGDFDGSITGAAKLFPAAVAAGVFRPGIWESTKVTLFLAGIENTIILIFVLSFLIKNKWRNLYNIITGNSVLLFCFMFSVFFAFMIGLTTSNFGALVRFKIPYLPFLMSAIFITQYYINIYKRRIN